MSRDPGGNGSSEANSNNWRPGTEVVALHHFAGNSPEDLSFRRNDILHIIRATRDPMWYFARHVLNDREGMIPRNYVQEREEVQLNAMPWFHGKLTREKAEEVLNTRQDGLFLIRESNNFPGDYTLCVTCDGKVEHYHIIYHHNQLTIDEEVYFEELNSLVQHYKNDADGLCVKLSQSVEKGDGKMDYAVNRQEFVNKGWVIKVTDIEYGEVLGRGEFGDVKKGDFNGKSVAVKCLKDSSAAQTFLNEASLMTSLQHPNLVQLLGVVLGDSVYIVTEFMGKGSLVEYLRSRGRSVITKQDQINFASDTCNGMAYLEQKKVVHRDLAARNVLIHDSTVAKVSDFGLARHADSRHSAGKVPIKWTAPEALRENAFTSKSDMWSFGVLLWEIYSFGRVPYPRIPLSDVVMHVEKGYRMEAPDGCPDSVYNIMKSAWCLLPHERPSFTDITEELNKLRKTT